MHHGIVASQFQKQYHAATMSPRNDNQTSDWQAKDRLSARVETGLMTGMRQSAATYDRPLQDMVEIAFREFLNRDDNRWPVINGERILISRNGQLPAPEDVAVKEHDEVRNHVTISLPHSPGIYTILWNKFSLPCELNVDDIRTSTSFPYVMFENEAFRVLLYVGNFELEFRIYLKQIKKIEYSKRTLKSTEIPIDINIQNDLNSLSFDVDKTKLLLARDLLKRDFPDANDLIEDISENADRQLDNPLLLWESTFRLPSFFQGENYSKYDCRILQLDGGSHPEGMREGLLQRLFKNYNSQIAYEGVQALFNTSSYSLAMDNLILCHALQNYNDGHYLSKPIESVLCISFSGYEAAFLSKHNDSVEHIGAVEVLEGWEPIIEYNLALNNCEGKIFHGLDDVLSRASGRYDLCIGVPPFMPGTPGHEEVFKKFLKRCGDIASEVVLGLSSIVTDEFEELCKHNDEAIADRELIFERRLPLVPIGAVPEPIHPESDLWKEPGARDWNVLKSEYDTAAQYFEQLREREPSALGDPPRDENGNLMPGAKQYRCWHSSQIWRLKTGD